MRASSSSALYFSASCTIFSISSLLRRPLSLVIVILLFLPAGAVRQHPFKGHHMPEP